MNAITQPVLFDYNTLDTESRVKLQQLEREIKEDHHEVDRLVAETLDKMWRIGGKYHEVQILLGSRFKQWFMATHEADNGGLLRKAYRCINIHQNVSRDNLSLLAKTGKTTVYTLAARETPNAARAEIFKRLKAEEALTTNDIVEIIESAKAAEMPMMLPMVIDEPVIVEIKQEFVHEELNAPGSVADDHVVDTNKMDAPSRNPDVSTGYREAMKPVGTPKFTPGIINKPEVAPPAPVKTQARRCIHCNNEQQIEMSGLHTCGKCYKTERFDKWLDSPKSESPTVSAAPIAPPPPPPVAKPVSELAKVDYDDDDEAESDDEGDEAHEPVELKAAPIAPPPPAMPLPPPPPPLVGRTQIDIAVEFQKLSEEKQLEVAWLILNKLNKKQVSDLFIKYQTEGRK